MYYVYVTIEKILSETAPATRILSDANLLTQTGKKVIILSLDKIKPGVSISFQGIEIISLRSLSNSIWQRASNLIMHKKRLKDSLIKLYNEYVIEGIFFYDIPPHSILYLKKFAKKQNIKIFHDSVEWYSPQQFKWGKFALPFVLKNIMNRRIIDKQVSVITISRFLQNYFKAKGIKTIRIPIIMDMERIACEKKKQEGKLKILYAGSPGRKDYLNMIIEGMSLLLKEDLNNIEFNVLGITQQQLIQNCDVNENFLVKCGDNIMAHGRVTREEVLEYLKYTDFTVLLRDPDLRYSKAGFPTKVVESLATATPVICNLTSDLGEYLKNGDNCLIVNSCSATELAETLKRAIALSANEKRLLSYNARKTAEKNFDFRNYITEFSKFLKMKTQD